MPRIEPTRAKRTLARALTERLKPPVVNHPKLLKVVLTTDRQKKELRAYSYHIIEAVYTCHTWGVVRYGLGKVYESSGRAMALEAGGAMHEVFAAIRIWQLAHVQGLPEHAEVVGQRVFKEKWESTREFILNCDPDEPRESLINLSYHVLHNTGFYDDDRDTVRTLTNMESATITYVDEQIKTIDQWPIYVEDVNDPRSTTGIELTIDAVLHYRNGKRIRYIGTADAVLQCILDRTTDKRETYLGENKTASRLDDSWRFSFEMSHQVTGYNVLTTTLLKKSTLKSKVFGLRLQPGKQDTYESFEPQERTEVMVQKWAEWVYGGVELYDMYDGDYENAKRLTHSCNRYFRPCALLPFCSDTPEGRDQQIEQMVQGEMSPSEQAVQLGAGV